MLLKYIICLPFCFVYYVYVLISKVTKLQDHVGNALTITCTQFCGNSLMARCYFNYIRILQNRSDLRGFCLKPYQTYRSH